MHVLVTRPAQDAGPLMDRLAELGVASSAAPLISIRVKKGAKPKLSGVQGILATSANGIRAFAALAKTRELPVFAVGDATARAAAAAGFERIESAGGDVGALAQLVRARVDPAAGALLHVAGTKLSGSLGKTLKEKGFSYRRTVLYDAAVATGIGSGTLEAIREGRIDGVLLFSPRTAEAFVTLARKARLVRSCAGLSVYCLSQAVAERAGALPWRAVHVAENPDQESLLALLGEQKKGPWSEMSDSVEKDKPIEAVEAASEEMLTPERAGKDGAFEAAVAEESARKLTRRSIVPTVVLWMLLLIAVFGGAVYAARPFWAPYADAYIQALQKDPFLDSRMTSLSERLGALERLAKENQRSQDTLSKLEARRTEISDQVGTLVARVNDLEASLASVEQFFETATLPLEAADARESLGELNARIAKLENSKAVSGLRADIELLGVESDKISASVDEMANRIDGLEEAGETMGGGGRGKMRETILAAERLREALRTSAPFAEELETFRGVAADHIDLVKVADELAPFAESGISPLASLRERFGGVAGRIVVAAHRMEGDGWVAAAINRLSSLVSVRRTDAAAGARSADAIVATAENAIGDGDLMGAVTALQTFDGAAAAAAAPWLADARARVIAQRSMAVLHVHSVSMMTPFATPPAGK